MRTASEAQITCPVTGIMRPQKKTEGAAEGGRRGPVLPPLPHTHCQVPGSHTASQSQPQDKVDGRTQVPPQSLPSARLQAGLATLPSTYPGATHRAPKATHTPI